MKKLFLEQEYSLDGIELGTTHEDRIALELDRLAGISVGGVDQSHLDRLVDTTKRSLNNRSSFSKGTQNGEKTFEASRAARTEARKSIGEDIPHSRSAAERRKILETYQAAYEIEYKQGMVEERLGRVIENAVASADNTRFSERLLAVSMGTAETITFSGLPEFKDLETTIEDVEFSVKETFPVMMQELGENNGVTINNFWKFAGESESERDVLEVFQNEFLQRFKSKHQVERPVDKEN